MAQAGTQVGGKAAGQPAIGSKQGWAGGLRPGQTRPSEDAPRESVLPGGNTQYFTHSLTRSIDIGKAAPVDQTLS